jgi:hypothetical protein
VSVKLPHLSAGFAAATIRARRGSASTSDMSEPGSGECLRDASSAAPRPVLRRPTQAGNARHAEQLLHPNHFQLEGRRGCQIAAHFCLGRAHCVTQRNELELDSFCP